jgi:hypothetical protein
MKNLFGFIAYKLAKKKDEILEKLSIVGFIAFMFVPYIVLMISPILFGLTLFWTLVCTVLAFVWIGSVLVAFLYGSDIVDKIKGFFTEYRYWRKRQEDKK